MKPSLITAILSLTAATLAAPIPKDLIDINGIGDVDIGVKRATSHEKNAVNNLISVGSASASIKRFAAPEDDLTVGVGGLNVDAKRDFVSELSDLEAEASDLAADAQAAVDASS